MAEPSNRQLIVEAAKQLFSKHGYAETSIADIATQAGLLKGNLSYYFKTKADVLICVTEAHKEELFARLAARLRPGMSTRESIEQFLQTVEASADELARSGCPIGTLCSEIGKEHPELQHFASNILRALQDWLRQEFARVFPDDVAQSHAEQLLTLMQGAAIMAHAFNDKELVLRRVNEARRWLAFNLPDETEGIGVAGKATI